MIQYNHLLCFVFTTNCFSRYPILSYQDLTPVTYLDLYGNLYVQVRVMKQKKFFLKNFAHCMLILC
jgi:hypothetical protein